MEIMEYNSNRPLGDHAMSALTTRALNTRNELASIDNVVSGQHHHQLLSTILLHPETGDFLHPRCLVKFKFASDSWMNMMKITLTGETQIEDQTIMVQATFFINHKSLVDNSKLTEYPTNDFVLNYQRAPINANLKVWQVTLTLNLNFLSNEQIFAGCPEFAQSVARCLIETSRICMLIVADGAFVGRFERICSLFQQENRRDPVLRFSTVTSGGRPVFRLGRHSATQNRPQYEGLDYNLRYSFRDFTDWTVAIGYGAIVEHEHQHRKTSTYGHGTHIMRVTELPGGGEGEYIGFLPVPAADGLRLRPGDLLDVCMDEYEDLTASWRARLTQPIPGTPDTLFTIYLYRPWNEETGEFEDKTEFPVISLTDLRDKNPDHPFRTICQHGGIQVKVRVPDFDCVFNRKMKALDVITTAKPDVLVGNLSKDLRRVLPATRLDKIPKHDVFADCRSKFPQVETVMNLNGEQLVAIRATASACAGLSLVHGPPGTGITYLLRQCAKPPKMMDSNVQVLALSPTNPGANSLCRALHEELRLLQLAGTAPGWKYVVRVHSKNTTTELWKRTGRLKKGQPRNVRPDARDLNNSDRIFLEELDIARHYHEAREKDNSMRYTLIDDDRVEDIELSLGYRCLQCVGLVKGGPRLPDELQDHCVNFVTSYRQWCAAKEQIDFMDFQMEIMMEQAEIIKEFVLTAAACVVTTYSNVAIDEIRSGCQKSISIILIDEFAREAESVFLPIVAAPFTKLKGNIGVGDPYQLGHLVRSQPKTNPLTAQIQLPLQARLQAVGFESTLLRQQWRMLPDIAAGPNQIVYGGQLIHAPGVAYSNRPIARELVEFNGKKFGKPYPIIYLDVRDGNENVAAKTLTVYDKSRCNELYLVVIINLLVSLLEKFPNAKIAYCTAYTAQMRLALSARDRMVTNGLKNVENLTVCTWDGSQGSEWDIGVIDILINSTAGFQDDKSRLNVIFTRFRDGMYVVSSKEAINSLRRAPWLQKFQGTILKYRHPLRLVTPPKCTFYTPGQTDRQDTR